MRVTVAGVLVGYGWPYPFLSLTSVRSIEGVGRGGRRRGRQTNIPPTRVQSKQGDSSNQVVLFIHSVSSATTVVKDRSMLACVKMPTRPFVPNITVLLLLRSPMLLLLLLLLRRRALSLSSLPSPPPLPPRSRSLGQEVFVHMFDDVGPAVMGRSPQRITPLNRWVMSPAAFTSTLGRSRKRATVFAVFVVVAAFTLPTTCRATSAAAAGAAGAGSCSVASSMLALCAATADMCQSMPLRENRCPEQPIG